MGCIESKNRLKEDTFYYINKKIGGDVDSMQLSMHSSQTEKLHSDYQIIGHLYSNQSKNIKKVVHKLSGKVLCMRIMKRDSLNEDELNRYKRQIEILKLVNHPNIIRIQESFEDEINMYLVTEYCSGGELFDKILNQVSLQESQAASIMRDLLEALDHCHKNNIVHRDIKPENLLFESDTENSLLKLTDFKHAKICKNTETLKKQFGGVFYMAPEVIKGEYNSKCDIWSCGVILYIILCGYPPFFGVSDDLIKENILKGEILFIGPEWDEISVEAKRLVEKLLTFDPEKRITAEDALKDTWIQTNSIENVNMTNSYNFCHKKSISNLKYMQICSKIQNIFNDHISAREKIDLIDKDYRSIININLIKNEEGLSNRNDFIKNLEGFKNTVNENWITELIDNLKNENVENVNVNEILDLVKDKRIWLIKEKLKEEFEGLEKKNVDEVSVEELKKAFFSEKKNEKYVKELISYCEALGNQTVKISQLREIILNKKELF